MSADKAYDSEKARQQIKDEGALPVIPSRSNATKKAYCPKRFYRATRYDKLARNFLAATLMIGTLYWIKL